MYDVLKREVALGVVYFRQGLQGYASLTDESNYGISDIKLAINFIYNNLQQFNIDGSIILASENDGASALHMAFDEWIQDHQGKVEEVKELILVMSFYITNFA